MKALGYLHHVSCIVPDTEVSVELQTLISGRELQRHRERNRGGGVSEHQ